MDRHKKDTAEIMKVGREYGTLLFYDGCQWLYNSPNGFENYYLDRQRRAKDFMRSYVDALEENERLKGELYTRDKIVKDMIGTKLTNEDYRRYINQLGGSMQSRGVGSFVSDYNQNEGINLKKLP